MRTIYACLWISWVVAFLAIEFSALGTGHNELTLSDFVWRLEEVNRAWTALRFFLACGLLWLLLHIVFGIFR